MKMKKKAEILNLLKRKIDPDKDKDLLFKLLPSLQKTEGVDGGHQHDETIYEHCIMVGNAIDNIDFPLDPPRDHLLLKLAALLHDVGKPLTMSAEYLVDSSSVTFQVIHFYGHDQVSEKLARKDLERGGFKKSEIEYVCSLIANHMFYFEEISKAAAYRRLMKKLSDVNVPIRDLLRLRIADRKGNLAQKMKVDITWAFMRTLKMIEAIEEDDRTFKLKDLAVNGRDIMKYFDIQEGRSVGRILDYLLEEVKRDMSLNLKKVLLERVLKTDPLLKKTIK